MYRGLTFCIVAAALAWSTEAFAINTTGTLNFTATVEESVTITLTSDVQGATPDGANGVLVNLGTIGRNAPLIGNVSRTTTASTWTLQFSILVTITSNGTGWSTTLTAALASTPTGGVTWSLDSNVLSTSPTAIALPFANSFNLPVAITIPNTFNSNINNGVVLTVTSQ